MRINDSINGNIALNNELTNIETALVVLQQEISGAGGGIVADVTVAITNNYPDNIQINAHTTTYENGAVWCTINYHEMMPTYNAYNQFLVNGDAIPWNGTASTIVTYDDGSGSIVTAQVTIVHVDIDASTDGFALNVQDGTKDFSWTYLVYPADLSSGPILQPAQFPSASITI